MGEFIRARSPEHKQERIREIMAAADSLFQALPYSDVTLSLIGKELGWSRANLYKYVATKEEIFLLLHSEKDEAYCRDLLQTFTQLPMNAAAFARAWAQATERAEELLKYQDILVPVIEANVSFEALVAFKGRHFKMHEPVNEVLATQCDISAADASQLYYTLIYQACGLRNHYNCAKIAADAMKAVGAPPITGSFEESYTRFVLMCLQNASGKAALMPEA